MARKATYFQPMLVLALAALSFGRTHAQPGDFGFRFDYGCNGSERGRLDTFDGTFTANPGSPNPSASVTIPLLLSVEQMRTISDGVEQIRFFDYPAVFTSVPGGVSATQAIQVNHFEQYRLEVRHSGRLHAVSWVDNIVFPRIEEANRLRQLLRMIRGILNEYPEVRRVPVYACG